MSKIFSDKYILKYQKDCLKLLWYERDMMTYFDYLKCKEMRDDPDSYFKNVKELISILFTTNLIVIN